MGLRGQMHHHVGPEAFENFPHLIGIADVGFKKTV